MRKRRKGSESLNVLNSNVTYQSSAVGTSFWGDRCSSSDGLQAASSILNRTSNSACIMSVSGLILLLCAAATLANQCQRNAIFKDAGPLVETNKGSVVGRYERVRGNDVAAFLGIPFAKPPVGEKRFQHTEPADPWPGLLLANSKPATCHQYSTKNITQFPWLPPPGERSEDCLYLNVWSPVRCGHGDSKKTVLVWILPGGFAVGSSSMDLYDGGFLASYGDVVVVTFNYRMGVFGFLNAGIDEAPGNAGLHDQILALTWVKENIEHFGGDPDSITVFGESAGAISASLHLLSPLSKNLFNRAILMSGAAYQPLLVDKPSVALQKANTIAEEIGCANKTTNAFTDVRQVVQCLKDKDPYELSRTELSLLLNFPAFFVPSYNTSALPKSPIASINAGEITQIDVLIGLVKDEGTIFLSYGLPDIFPIDGTPSPSFNQSDSILSYIFPALTNPSHDLIFEHYYGNATNIDSGTVTKALSNIVADYIFKCPVLFFAEKLDRAFMYYNTHRSEKEFKSEWMGLSHFFDVAYVFGIPVVDDNNYSEEDKIFSEDIMQKWLNFARYGNPLRDDSEETWPTFTPSEQMVHELNPKNQNNNFKFPRTEACGFWKQHFA